MPRHKETDRQGTMAHTRQLLLQAATAEFAREGYAGANVNRISRAAGFAKGTIYNYFPSKRALMLALIAEIAQAHFSYVSERVTAQDDPARRLEHFFEAGFDWVAENLDRGRVMIVTLNGPDPEFKGTMYEAYRPMFQLVGLDIVAAGVERGTFRRVDPEGAAQLLMTIYLGVASQVNERGRPWFTPAQVTDLLLDGLRRQDRDTVKECDERPG
jgi:AcrR family transcriptional regulator